MTTSRAAASTRPLRADAERNRQRILVAAREVFAARGLDAGLDEIAKHAGLGVGTVYRRFPDKDALITELFADRTAELAKAAANAAARADPWEAFCELVENIAAMHATDRGLRDLVFTYADTDVIREQLEIIDAHINQTMQRAVAAGKLRPDVTATDIAVIFFMLAAADDVLHREDGDAWRRYVQLILDGLADDGTTRSTLRTAPVSWPPRPSTSLTI